MERRPVKPGCSASHPESGLHPALPASAPLLVQRSRLHARRARLRRTRRPVWQRLRVALARLLVFVGTAAVATYGIGEAWAVVSTAGVTPLQWLFLLLFGANFSWIAFSVAQSVLGLMAGLIAGLRPRQREAASLRLRTAVLVPVYSEPASSVAANMAAMSRDLDRRFPGRFAFFLLSDTRPADDWLNEEAVFRSLIGEAPSGCPIYYRHRADNTERKAGNIAQWLSRFGGDWDAMIILDADSLMSAECMGELAHRLQRSTDLGMIQSLPRIARAASLFGRLQQFAGACYGPLFAYGLAAWHGRSSNYWGHNAIIRVQAFAEAARLPILKGEPPFGADLLSHDFVEAAFVRRAGWGVRFDADLIDSFEETPPSLTDTIVRDRRWCQGNLQHLAVVWAHGLNVNSRIHLLTGIYAYVSAPVWLALVMVGLGLALQVQMIQPDYFARPSLFPTWPVFDTERAIRLLLITVGLVLAPKVLGTLVVLLDPRRWRGFAGPINLLASVLFETLLSALYAPILMVAQSRSVLAVLRGQDGGWRPQRRSDGRLPWTQVARAHAFDTSLGVLLAALAAWIEPDLFWWLVPVTAGLALSIPLSLLSASSLAGSLARRAGLLRVPSETVPAPIIRDARQAAVDAMPDIAPITGEREVLTSLASDRALRDWHFAQLEAPTDPRGHSEALLGALAKADRSTDLQMLAQWLEPAQLRALLGYRPFARRLEQLAAQEPGKPCEPRVMSRRGDRRRPP
jgi:membrane glycosyltransferase